MDPLHPPVSIQPPPPSPPTYNRVERIQRDGQGDSGPDWERGSEEEPDQESQEQFEDDYDPDWSDPAVAEPYGADGTLHDAAAPVDRRPETAPDWDPRVHPERRARPRDGDDDADGGSGQHIDISA